MGISEIRNNYFLVLMQIEKFSFISLCINGIIFNVSYKTVGTGFRTFLNDSCCS